MRPLHLSMTAFGPYADTETVDFEALAELGLFAVAGRNGSGKTTIFDGLHFALYGTLPGRRANYPRLRSDHAPPDAECRVVLDFVAHGRHWRVERLPKQRRAKRKGSGDTERAQRATLYEIVDGQPVAVVNRIAEVNQRCHELVGLTGPQFERVALLPQGEFSRLLRESASERRELLRALFSSDVFGDATTLLTDAAAEASRSGIVTGAHLGRRLDTIAEQVSELRGTTIAADVAELGRALADHRTTVVATRHGEVERARRSVADHVAAAQRAGDLAARIARRTEVRCALDDHEAGVEQHERDRSRLDAARAAVPVVDIASVAHNQRHALDAIDQRVTGLEDQLIPLLGGLEPPLALPDDVHRLDDIADELDRRVEHLRAHIDARARIHDLERVAEALQNELEQRERSRQTAGAQRAAAMQRRDELEAERERLDRQPDVTVEQVRLDEAERTLAGRIELGRVERQSTELRRDRDALEAELAGLDETIAAAERTGDDLARHERTVRSATAAVAELRRRLDAHRRFVAAVGQLEHARHAGQLARRRADHAFDAFIRGASARIADTLVDGDPCPVCGSPEHPAPAHPSSDAVDERDVADARAEADRTASAVARLEVELESLLAADPDVGDLEPDRLLEDIEIQTATAITAENEANVATAAIAALARHRERRADLARRVNASGERLDAIDRRSNQLIGALGADAGETVDRLRARRDQASARVRDAADAAERLTLIDAELLDLEARVDTIDLGCRDLDRQLAATHAELLARRADLALARRQLAGAGPADPDRELTAVRQANQLLTRLQSARAERVSAADASRRAELTLNEKLAPSPFDTVQQALDAYLEVDVVLALEASTAAWTDTASRLEGELRALGDLPDLAPDVDALRQTAQAAEAELRELEHDHNRLVATVDRLDEELRELAAERARLDEEQVATRRLERVASLVKGDNAHNTSLENWVLAAHLRDVVELANVRLARSTQHRFQLVVLAEGENRRSRWGLDLAVEDTITGTHRPTAGLSGGELFQASLALALGLADVVMNQRSGVSIDALFIDEGFGALDDTAVERVLDLLDDLRSRGATVGVITHVTALLDVLPRGISVVPHPDGNGSTIRQVARAA